MFSELGNVDVLCRLGGAPGVALLTAGHPALFISICKQQHISLERCYISELREGAEI